MLLHIAQHQIKGGETCLVRCNADLTKEQMIARRLSPLRDRGQTLDPNVRRHHTGMLATAVSIQILMNLKCKIMEGIMNAGANHGGVVGRCPRPGTVIVTPGNKDFLRGTGAADRRNRVVD